ncbi:MAG: NADPH:quinone oxidoreductase [Pseudomonadota bacterium]
MKAWFCDTLGGVQSLQWREAPTLVPQEGEVVLKIHAASLNFPDLLIVEGKYQIKPPLPFVPGSEFCGTVEALGPGVTHLRIADRVAVLGSTGGFATHACVKAKGVIPLPQEMDLDDAAAFAFTYGTSYHALMDRGALKPNETVLVLGAAGGVGSAAVQIAKAAGARVIAAVSSDAKAERCLEFGADATINYTNEDLRVALKNLTQGQGPDVIYDPVGGDVAEPAFRSIAWRGRYLVVGFAQGSIPSLPLNLSLLKGASLVGVFWGAFVQREPKAFEQDMAQLMTWYRQGKVKPVIDHKLPMSAIVQAYDRMASRKVVGKLLLVNE